MSYDKRVIGPCELYLGDCREILPTLGPVDVVVTDPPYNAVNRETAGIRDMDKGGADSLPVDISYMATEFVRISRGSIYVWCSTEQVSEWRRSFVAAKATTRQCVWEKTNPSPVNCQSLWLSSVELCVFARKSKATFNRFYEAPVWRGPSERVVGFPCPKPVWLMKELIDASTEFNGVVIDPYLGSGTTGVACVQTGRRFIGIETDRTYFDLACKRLEDAVEQSS